jgi:hypothetical protein
MDVDTAAAPAAHDGDWLDPAQQRAWRAYLVGTTLLMDRLDRELRDQHRISLPEYEILVRLSEAEGHRMRMAELADSVSHSRSRVTHTVSRMEAAGLVARDACLRRPRPPTSRACGGSSSTSPRTTTSRRWAACSTP